MFFHVFPFFALFKHNLRKHLKNPYISMTYGARRSPRNPYAVRLTALQQQTKSL
tara:strand:+ start:470 stop:631 length:162 start_codon:yes stop_codon:yes gene_type:complete